MPTQLENYMAELTSVPGAPFWLDVAAKATVLLLAAIAAAALLRRSSAALRHRIWCMTFAALVLLPGLSAALPEWRLAILPYRGPLAGREESVPLAVQSARPDAPTRQELAGPPALQPALPLAEQAVSEAPHRSDASPAETAAAHPPLNLAPLNLAVFWLVGALVALSPLVVGLARTLLLRRQAKPVDSAVWTSLLDELRQRLALARCVGLFETDSALMPMTWGVLRPVVLLPRHARQWTDRLRRFVLLHELAHVKRCDVGFQILGRLACALYWFHPLAWYALRRLRIERELACDDCVVLAGERATDYAAELLQIARSYRPVPFAAAVAMAQRGNLEHRLCALFDRACSHLPVSARAARLLLAGVMVLVTAVAAVRLAPRASAGDDKQDPASAETKDGIAPANTTESNSTLHEPGTSGAAAKRSRIRARVIDTEGNPIAGARVRAVRVDTQETAWTETGHVVGEGRTSDTGEVALDYSDTAPFASGDNFISTGVVLLADAEGHAFDWHDTGAGGDAILKLPADDSQIEGRVLDLEGRPRSGVRVSIVHVDSSAKDLDAWVEAAKKNPVAIDESTIGKSIRARETEGPPVVARFPGNKNLQLGHPALLPRSVTDAQGRFRLTGVGRDRLIRLELAGGDIARTWLNVVTRDMPAVPYPEHDPRFRVPTCFGRRFDLTAEPEQLIAGVVRDAAGGRPIAGVEVRLSQYAGRSSLVVEGFLSAVTDEQGRYTLRGVPKPHDPKRALRLRIVPPTDQPYFRTDIDVARRDGLDAVTCDVALKPGIWLRGRVTNAVTGKPLRGMVEYYPFLSNQAAAAYPNFDPGMHSLQGDRYPIDDEGAYRLPALPGRGLLTFIAKDADRYPEADGADAIAELRQQSGNWLNVYHLHAPEYVTAVREVDPPRDAVEAVCDIRLRPLEVERVELVDPDGAALTGAVTMRLTPMRTGGYHYIGWSYEGLPNATAEIVGPRDQPRTVMFLHRERKLAAALSLPTPGNSPKQLVLRACASISGRIVDHQGKPVGKLYFEVNASPGPEGKEPAGKAHASGEVEHQLDRLPTDENGRFRVELVPPGVPYVVWASLGDSKLEKTTPVIQPGQVLDLGELPLQPSGTPTPGQERPAASKKRIRGRVIAPNEKPVEGARIWLKGPFEKQWTAVAETDARGAFQFDVASDTLRQALGKDPKLTVRLAATADGLGFAWTDIRNIDAGNDELAEVALRMVEDVRVEGRILTADGQPAAGVNAGVLDIRQPNRPTLDEYISAARKDGAGFHSFVDDTWRGNVPGQADAVTDDEGRFRLTGIGAERLALLSLHGQAVHNWWIVVATRHVPDGEPERKENGALHLAAAPYDNHYYARFTHVSEPARTLRGTVVDRTTAAPVAGAQVKADFITSVVATTGPDGRFELVGCRKEGRYQIKVASSQAGYFLREIYVPDGPGAQPLEFQVEMVKGVTARGRVTDQETGEPVAGTVEYYPLFPNPFISRLGAVATPCSSSSIAKDGDYELQALPGPGVIAVRNYDQKYGMPRIDLERVNALLDGVEPFIRNDEEHLGIAVGGEAVGMISPFQFKALELIKPDDGATTLSQDLVLVPGRNIDGTLLGPNNEPIKGAMVAGAQAQYVSLAAYEKLDGEQFTVQAVVHDQVRTVLFYHAEQRLGAKLEIPKGHEGNLTVRLQACAAVTGRLVDAGGAPARETTVVLTHHRSSFAGTRTWTGKTDGEGSFRVDGLIPDLDYLATVHGKSVFSVNLKPGEIHDAGLIEQIGSEEQ